MAPTEFLKKYRDYIIIATLVAAITGGNYILSGGAKSNWVEVSDYGFTLLYSQGVNVWITGLDDDNVFDINGAIHATRNAGMIGFNDKNKEFAVTWVKFDEKPSLEDILEIHYHSGEVNSVKRDRGFKLDKEAVTYGEVNGHDAAYQIHTFELDMLDMDEPLLAKGVAVGWTCDDTGVSYVGYVLFWNAGEAPSQSDSQILSSLHWYLDTLKCH